MRVMPMSVVVVVTNVKEFAVAIGQQVRHEFVVVFPGIEKTGDRGGTDRRSAAAAADVIGDPAFSLVDGAAVDVFDRFVDDLPGNRDSGVPATPKGLDLRDRRRTLVEIVAVLGTDVSPTAFARLGLAGELDAFAFVPPKSKAGVAKG